MAFPNALIFSAQRPRHHVHLDHSASLVPRRPDLFNVQLKRSGRLGTRLSFCYEIPDRSNVMQGICTMVDSMITPDGVYIKLA